MAKATIQNVKDEGFRPDQFSGLTASFDAFLTDVVDEAGRWAEAMIGATLYAAQTAPSYAFDLIKRAELCYAVARLWKRRAGFFDASAHIGLESPEYLERREYLAHASGAYACALSVLGEAMRLLGLDPGVLSDVPAMATGMIETGRFPATQEARLNV